MATLASGGVLFSIEVASTSDGREHWAKRPWLSTEAIKYVRNSEVVILPWEDFREGQPILFPQGTTEFIKALQDKFPLNAVGLPVDKDGYLEITLHSDIFRVPKMLVTLVALPIVLGVISNRIDRAIPDISSQSAPAIQQDLKSNPTVELELIVEGQRGKCILVKYKGPANQVLDTVVKQVESCLPKVEQSDQQ